MPVVGVLVGLLCSYISVEATRPRGLLRGLLRGLEAYYEASFDSTFVRTTAASPESLAPPTFNNVRIELTE
jgi:hypothetical protein